MDTERISWDEYFMAQAHLLALRSTCTRLSVGATIVRDKRIIAGGYNGSVSGDVHCIDEGCYVVDDHCVRTIHAEVNALLQCAKFGIPTRGAEIYVTHFPCLHCSKAIVQAGIKAIYYASDYKNDPYAIELFQQAGVKMKHVAFHSLYIEKEPQKKQAVVNALRHQLEEKGIDDEEILQLLNEL
ncbi:MAG TPA: ComE operon protein 2 [Massilibacterium sp.]|nr:ComE operon protein 2 [Massilibacterium sp.]